MKQARGNNLGSMWGWAELTLAARGRFGIPRADQRQGGHVIVNGRLAHELLYAIDYGGAQFLRILVGRLLHTRFDALQSEFLAAALAFEQTSGNQ